MCFEDPTQPYAMPLAVHRTWLRTEVLTYSVLLLKVTQLCGDVHRSHMGGFAYPVRQLVNDPNAKVADHQRALHFAASPAVAYQLSSYGSHRLAVLPGRKVWDPVSRRHGLNNRCWHSDSALTAFCYDCEGVTLDVVKDPDFWQDLKLSPQYISDEFIDSVWHKRKRLPRNAA
jgi:hypothetical protein